MQNSTIIPSYIKSIAPPITFVYLLWNQFVFLLWTKSLMINTLLNFKDMWVWQSDMNSLLFIPYFSFLLQISTLLFVYSIKQSPSILHQAAKIFGLLLLLFFGCLLLWLIISYGAITDFPRSLSPCPFLWCLRPFFSYGGTGWCAKE